MKITHDKVGQNVNLTDTRKTEKSGKTKTSGIADEKLAALDSKVSPNEASTVSLSERAQDIVKAKQLAMSAPDIREDRVADLQKLIDSGNYKVASKDIADKMVDEEAQWS